MSQEEYPVEFVLEGIDSIMPVSRQPKVLSVLPRQNCETLLTTSLLDCLISEEFV